MGVSTRVATLVVAKPGLMRNSLLAFLRATLQVEVVALAEDTAAALQAARQHKLDVLVLDTDLLEDGYVGLLQQLHSEQPALKCIVLSDTIHQQQKSLAAGASVALLKGFLDERLWDALVDHRC